MFHAISISPLSILGAVALSTAILAGAPSHTNAAVRAGNGATASTTINCSQSMHWMRSTVTIKPRPGVASQTVSFRQYIAPINGAAGAWTNWTNMTAPFTTTFVANVSNLNFQVYMQYAWFQNGQWTYAGEWIQTYGQVYGSAVYNYSYCAV
jgi:hypothetical protein